jgi:hypothetical protein
VFRSQFVNPAKIGISLASLADPSLALFPFTQRENGFMKV